MRKKRPISSREGFQVTYVATLHNSPLLRWELHILTSEEKSDTQHLNQAINVSVKRNTMWDFPGGPVVKNPPGNAGHISSTPGPGRPLKPRGN